MRDDDARWSEHHSDAELDAMRALGLVHPCGVVPCGECEQTGVVSAERLADLMAAARASVDQAMARVRDSV